MPCLETLSKSASLFISSHLAEQLLQLCVVDLSNKQTIRIPARMTSAGRVATVEDNAPAFLMHVPDSPYLGAPLYPISLRGLLPVHTACRRIFRCVPKPNSVLTFTGVIIAVEHGISTIAVDEFAYLPQATAIVINTAPVTNDGDDIEDVD
jgi:hypothetical protein